MSVATRPLRSSRTQPHTISPRNTRPAAVSAMGRRAPKADERGHTPAQIQPHPAAHHQPAQHQAGRRQRHGRPIQVSRARHRQVSAGHQSQQRELEKAFDGVVPAEPGARVRPHHATILQPMPVRYTTAGMLAVPEVTHLGPVFEASRALDHWIANHCPDSLYVGTFWALCLSPLVFAILAVAVRPNRPRGRGRPPLFLALILGALLLARLPGVGGRRLPAPPPRAAGGARLYSWL